LPPLLFIWLGLLGVFLRRRTLVLLALFACYASATPQLALWLARPLEPASIATQDRLTQIDAIVVLGGGSRWGPEYGSDQLGAESLGRLNYAATLARRSGKPLLLSGGAPLGGEPEARVMMRTLQENAALSARWIEPRSNTTAENARESARLLWSPVPGMNAALWPILSDRGLSYCRLPPVLSAIRDRSGYVFCRTGLPCSKPIALRASGWQSPAINLAVICRSPLLFVPIPGEIIASHEVGTAGAACWMMSAAEPGYMKHTDQKVDSVMVLPHA
jgi:hypothetical protein